MQSSLIIATGSDDPHAKAESIKEQSIN